MTAPFPRAAFDVTPVISGRTGIARYVTQVGGALERQGVTLRRFAVGRSAYPVPCETRHIRVPARYVDAWWRAVPWPRVEQIVGAADVVHATGLLMPATRRPLVVTVHDVAALQRPELHPIRHVRQQRAQLATLDRATVIVTVSQATADELVALGVEPERLVVAPLGVTPLPKRPPVIEPARRPYLLTVGETSPRKGYAVILEALSRLDDDLRLVIAGPPAGDEQRLRALAADLGLSSRITRLGPVSDALLAGLYRGAVALCFPSRAEGFGLPVLEAMAEGAPVLASDLPVTRELAGDAAMYVAADDEPAWAKAIGTIASDAGLRERLASAGRQRAARFTWARTAAMTLHAYRLALDTTP